MEEKNQECEVLNQILTRVAHIFKWDTFQQLYRYVLDLKSVKCETKEFCQQRQSESIHFSKAFFYLNKIQLVRHD